MPLSPAARLTPDRWAGRGRRKPCGDEVVAELVAIVKQVGLPIIGARQTIGFWVVAGHTAEDALLFPALDS